MDDLVRKLNPARFPGMSPFMAAIVGFVLGEPFTDPEIAEITVSEAENLVYVRKVGAVGFDGLQSLEDLRQLEPIARRRRADRRRAAGSRAAVQLEGGAIAADGSVGASSFASSTNPRKWFRPELAKYQTGFDGFPQANFVGQQDAFGEWRAEGEQGGFNLVRIEVNGCIEK
jgi:hypothetical protein